MKNLLSFDEYCKETEIYERQAMLEQLELAKNDIEEFKKYIHIKEADVKSESDFKEYAIKVLKKQHKDDFDQKIADETIEDLIKKSEGDWGVAIGMLNKG